MAETYPVPSVTARRYSQVGLFAVIAVVFYFGLKATKAHGSTPVETCVWPHVCIHSK